MNVLRNGEHAEFGTSIVDHIKVFIIAVLKLVLYWNRYETAVNHENLVFRISAESAESKLIAKADKERDSLFNEIRHELQYFTKNNNAAIKDAAEKLLFILKTYGDATKKNLFEETKFIQNFLADINKAANAPFLALLPGIAALLQQLEAINTQLYELYQQRLQALEAIEELGKPADIRKEVDETLADLIDHINVVYEYNEMTDKDPDIKSNLESAASYLKGLIAQTERVLSRRDHHHKKTTSPPETPPATPPETPDTPPATPDTPPQNPDTNLPAAPDTPNQNPVAVPPPINPEDLNPPAAGE
jgi:hypothetical protein